MAANNILKRWTAWVDGIGKAGNVKAYTPPALSIVSKDFQSGDMDMPIPIDVGMEAMESGLTLFGLDPLVLPLFGLKSGSKTTISVRSTYQDLLGTETELVEVLTGLITKIERDEQGVGDQSDNAMKVTMKLSYYKVTQAGLVLVEVDPINHVRKLGGVDVLEGIRAALQLS